MTRYIDADAAAELARLTYCKGCNSYNGVMCRTCGFDDAMTFIDDFPGADVAPKSEVAKDIFEEIKKCVVLKVIHNGEVLYDRTEQFAEVKKKYTEENNV